MNLWRSVRHAGLDISGSCDAITLWMFPVSTPSILIFYHWVNIIAGSLLTTHKHLSLNCSGGTTIVTMVNGRSANVKSENLSPGFCFCTQAESEVFWKVTLSANIMACEICSKKS